MNGPEVEIDKLVSSVGLKVGHPARGNVFSVAALRGVYRRNGPGILERSLVVLRDAYDSASEAFVGRLIDGISMVLATYSRIDDKLFARALGSVPHGIYGLLRGADHYRARLGRPLPECVAASAVDIYNLEAGRKRRLTKWWKALGAALGAAPAGPEDDGTEPPRASPPARGRRIVQLLTRGRSGHSRGPVREPA